MSLQDKIIQHIKINGPMGLDQYMDMVLSDPEYGYYMTRDPFGQSGDFTTSPEISQMFGEMIGMWAASLWHELGKPDPYHLVECGPGRGTLMADILRATNNVEGFREAARIHLVELSSVLTKVQQDTLKEFDVQWHKSLEDVEMDAPMILVANEFLDALPVKQYQKTADGWAERVVGLYGEEKLSIGLKPSSEFFTIDAEEGEVFEVSPARNNYVSMIDERLQKQFGGALFVDYGHTVSDCGDTLQAMQKHEYVDILHDPGNCDLTSHVDFEPFGFPCVTQSDFLLSVGIDVRAQSLKATASKKQTQDIDSALVRLIDEDEMGEMFKVMQIAYRGGTN